VVNAERRFCTIQLFFCVSLNKFFIIHSEAKIPRKNVSTFMYETIHKKYLQTVQNGKIRHLT